MLHDLVYEQYQIGKRFQSGFDRHFQSAAKLAELADHTPMSNDAYETVLFYGADALIRIGRDPTALIEKLEGRGLGAAAYLKGSSAYHLEKNSREAIPHLKKALADGSFVGRSARLLARIYYDVGDASHALSIFEQLGAARVNRDSGMLAQKIRCLRAVGRREDADALMANLRRLPDDYGHYELMAAAAHFRNRKFEEALEAISRAKLKQKVDRVSVALLEASIRIENGDVSELEEACNLAIGVGRPADALCLRARASLGRGNWRDAEQLIRKIEKPNFFDKVVLLRALDTALRDIETKADPTREQSIRDEIAKLTLEARGSIEDIER